jgi:hypothetical protein
MIKIFFNFNNLKFCLKRYPKNYEFDDEIFVQVWANNIGQGITSNISLIKHGFTWNE